MGRVGAYRYVACDGCGLARLDPMPTPSAVRDVFDPSYFSGGRVGGYDDYEADDSINMRNAHLRLDRLAPDLGTDSARLLDVGCALGHVLRDAHSRGWSALGVEICDEIAERARSGGAFHVAGDLAALAATRVGQFDAVTMFQVIEHLPRPDQDLALARSLLRPSGVIAFETWNRSSVVAKALGRHWQLLSPPSVLWAFDRRSLTLLLRRSGFDLVHYRRTWKWVGLRFSASLLHDGNRSALTTRLAQIAARLPLRDRAVPYALGDLVWVVARRRDN
ncbi:MAG: class I SAM-dependent methyltransferase [Acidimicrobiia bacterium]|nr:class I SAM-dependent methyltransferase [Acidimicrobiia bacterium]